MELVKTGIIGLDVLLKGGLRKNSSVLITGAPGTGKTLMALQFVYTGAKDYGENGVYITTEENLSDLREYALELDIDLVKYEKQGKLFLYQMNLATLRGGIVSIKGLLDLIKKKKIKRFGLDSLILFEYLYPKYNHTSVEFRRQILIFIKKIKELGVTSVVVSERKRTDFDKPEYTETEFVFDGYIILSRIRKGSYFERVITVAKMRGREHSLDIHPIQIGKGGVKILTDQTPFSLVEVEQKEFTKF